MTLPSAGFLTGAFHILLDEFYSCFAPDGSSLFMAIRICSAGVRGIWIVRGQSDLTGPF